MASLEDAIAGFEAATLVVDQAMIDLMTAAIQQDTSGVFAARDRLQDARQAESVMRRAFAHAIHDMVVRIVTEIQRDSLDLTEQVVTIHRQLTRAGYVLPKLSPTFEQRIPDHSHDPSFSN